MKLFRRSGAVLVVLSAGVLAGASIGCGGGEQPPAGRPQADANAKVVNSTCPIMAGNAVDRENTPANLIREYKGQKIGFCCAGCPDKWDKWTDEQKDAFLAKVASGG